MKSKICSVLFFLSANLVLVGQENVDTSCFPIKFLDFFGFEEQTKITWPDSEINAMLAMDYSSVSRDSTVKTNFIVPMIASQLKYFHPNCASKIDTPYFEKLVKIYLKIRQVDPISIQNKPLLEQLEFVRSDFHRQVEDPKYLPHMSFSLDDGPFYGEDFGQIDSLKILDTRKADFGEISISHFEKKAIVICHDKQGIVLWKKIMSRDHGNYLQEVHFSEPTVIRTSVATVIKMYAHGERLNLFLKNDGSFLYYLHSW